MVQEVANGYSLPIRSWTQWSACYSIDAYIHPHTCMNSYTRIFTCRKGRTAYMEMDFLPVKQIGRV